MQKDETRYELILNDSSCSFLQCALEHFLKVSEETCHRFYVPYPSFKDMRESVRNLMFRVDASCKGRNLRIERCGFRCFTRKDIVAALRKFAQDYVMESEKWEEQSYFATDEGFEAGGRVLGYSYCNDELNHIISLVLTDIETFDEDFESFLSADKTDFKRYGVTITRQEGEYITRAAEIFLCDEDSSGHPAKRQTDARKYLNRQYEVIQYSEFGDYYRATGRKYDICCREGVMENLVRLENQFENMAEDNRQKGCAALNNGNNRESLCRLGEASAIEKYAADLDIQIIQPVMEDISYVDRLAKSMSKITCV